MTFFIDDVRRLPLSKRALNVLLAADITSCRDVNRMSDSQLLRLPNCGKGTAAEIRAASTDYANDYHKAEKAAQFKEESLRDKFAIEAMKALLNYQRAEILPQLATIAYGMADAMLQERAK